MAPKKKYKRKVRDLAKDLGIKAKDVASVIADLGSGKPHPSACISPQDEEVVRKAMKCQHYTNGGKENLGRGKAHAYKWTDEQIQILKNCAAMSMTQSEIASVLGIGKSTLEKHLKDRPDLREIYDNSRPRGKARLLNEAYKLVGKGDRAMIMFLLKTQFGFNDRPKEAQLSASELATEVQEALENLEASMEDE